MDPIRKSTSHDLPVDVTLGLGLRVAGQSYAKSNTDSHNIQLSIDSATSNVIGPKPTNTNQTRPRLNHTNFAGKPSQHQGTRKPYILGQWKHCQLCQISFKAPAEFSIHLREQHCKREGGSFICKFGLHGVCPSLPVEGVSDRDYEVHVAKEHVGDEAYLKRIKKTSIHSMDSVEGSPSKSAPSVVRKPWTVYSSTVNLPAVLNDPRKSRRETDFFTKTWGESFVERPHLPPSPYVQEIARIHFDKYIKKTARKLRSLHKRRPSNQNDITKEVDGLESARVREKDAVQLDQVPKVFFRGDFHLENPETFEDVLPWSQFKGQQSSKLLQEKLSHYLDIVEVQISRHISSRSSAFFTAMASHDKLQEDLQRTCDAIRDLREKILRIDDVLSKNSLDILKLKVSRSNYAKVLNKLKLMATVHQTQPTIQLLLSTSEFVGALDLISTSQEVLSQELAGIQSFRHLGSQLVEMEKLIDKMLLGEFSTFATLSLNRSLEDTSPPEDEKLAGIVFGMLRQRQFNMLDTYKDEAFSAVRALLKQTVVNAVAVSGNGDVDTASSFPPPNAMQEDEKVSSLAEQMRLLNFSQWLGLFSSVFRNLLKLLERIKGTYSTIASLIMVAAGKSTVGEDDARENNIRENGVASHLEADDGVEDVTNQFGGLANGAVAQPCLPPSAIAEVTDRGDLDMDILIASGEYNRLMSGLNEMFASICDYTHDRCLKLLLARGKDGFLERLSSTEFVLLSRTVEAFVIDCEKVCGRKSTSLRGGLQNQANKFVNRFHDERKTKLGLILDSERWKQADVPAGLQELLTTMAKGDISLDLLAKTDNDTADKKPNGSVKLNGEKYAVVGTVLLLLKMVAEYCQCVRDMPSAAGDILTRLVEILQIFNSRSCQLILGAGALQLVGLKTITTKNLALTARCLQLVAFYIPIARDFFAERLPTKQMILLKNCDKICKDYNDHVQEIFNKLVAIMDDSLSQCLSTWVVKAPVPSPCFREICKRNRRLHEAISVLLPSEQVKDLFVLINESFKVRLKEQIVKHNVCNDGGPKQGLVTSDIHFYFENITSLDGMKDCIGPLNIWDKR
ncbi:vacuolar protein sorting-associated protein 54-like isoform X1 [Apostichopus japonicus]|uniref:vacuolar protein sorting-associated protein 54-like isoform X1 n=1 Tax=Stichopus japonicus TaxID=307972 RepID=UPI003AB7ADD1